MTRPALKFHGLRFPRTASEAFRDLHYSAAIEIPYPSFWRRLLQSVREVMA